MHKHATKNLEISSPDTGHKLAKLFRAEKHSALGVVFGCRTKQRKAQESVSYEDGV